MPVREEHAVPAWKEQMPLEAMEDEMRKSRLTQQRARLFRGFAAGAAVVLTTAWDAREREIPHLVLVPCLFLTLMFGLPAGCSTWESDRFGRRTRRRCNEGAEPALSG